jgi:hypothetical protein
VDGLKKVLEKIKYHWSGICLVTALVGLFALFSLWDPEEDDLALAKANQATKNKRKTASSFNTYSR